jgi:hypothetical protein
MKTIGLISNRISNQSKVGTGVEIRIAQSWTTQFSPDLSRLEQLP